MSSSGSGGIAYVLPSWPAPVGRRCSWAQLKGSSDSRQGRAITRLPAPQLSRTRCARTHGRTHRAPSGSDFAAAGGRSMLVNGPRRRCGRHGEVGADRPAAPASLQAEVSDRAPAPLDTPTSERDQHELPAAQLLPHPHGQAAVDGRRRSECLLSPRKTDRLQAPQQSSEAADTPTRSRS